MKWIIRGYSIALLMYTGWRTYDFMASQMPTGATGGFIAILFLFATELGLLLWHEVSMNHTTTEIQSHISVGLTWIDFIAATGAGIADMILRSTFADGYNVPPPAGYTPHLRTPAYRCRQCGRGAALPLK